MENCKRIGVYIDGNNLFYGALKNDERRRYRWLNPEKLVRVVCDNFFKKNICKIDYIKYYTARVSNRSGNLDAPRNQQIYFNALKTIKNLSIILGTFQLHPKLLPVYPLQAKQTGKLVFQQVLNTEEKGSDVNLATHLVFDACRDAMDVAVVITNDTDLAEPIRIVATELNKKVIIVCPHKTMAYSLLHIPNIWHYIIKTKHLEQSQFPDVVSENIAKPNHWCDI